VNGEDELVEIWLISFIYVYIQKRTMKLLTIALDGSKEEIVG
jgi:hypothetical protein